MKDIIAIYKKMKFNDLVIASLMTMTIIIKSFAVSKNLYQDYSSLIIFICSNLYILMNNNYIKSNLIKCVVIYYITLIIIFFLSLTIDYEVHAISLFNIWLFPLIFIFYYILAAKYPLIINIFKYIGTVVILIGFFNLIRLSSEANEQFGYIKIQNNAGNTLAAAIPFIFLWKNKYCKIILFLIVTIGIVYSLKRSAFVILLLVLLSFLIFKIKKISTLLFILTLVFGIFLYFKDHYLVSSLQERLSESMNDGGSGRDSLLSEGIQMYMDFDMFSLLFGAGYQGFSRQFFLQNNQLVTCAHNDFIEMLYDGGLFLLTMYLIMLYNLIRYGFLNFRESNTDVNMIIISSLIVIISSNLFVCSFIHYWYYLLLYMLIGVIYSLKLKTRN